MLHAYVAWVLTSAIVLTSIVVRQVQLWSAHATIQPSLPQFPGVFDVKRNATDFAFCVLSLHMRTSPYLGNRQRVVNSSSRVNVQAPKRKTAKKHRDPFPNTLVVALCSNVAAGELQAHQHRLQLVGRSSDRLGLHFWTGFFGGSLRKRRRFHHL